MTQPPDPTRITERERPLRFAHPVHPQSEMWQVLRANARARQADRDMARQRLAQSRERFASLAADLADVLHKLHGFMQVNQTVLDDAGLGDQALLLTGIIDKQEAALRQAGIRVLDPVGEPFDEQLAPLVEVRHAETAPDLARPVVSETLRPGVLLESGELVRPAQVMLAVPRSGGDAPAAASPPGEHGGQPPATGQMQIERTAE